MKHSLTVAARCTIFESIFANSEPISTRFQAENALLLTPWNVSDGPVPLLRSSPASSLRQRQQQQQLRDAAQATNTAGGFGGWPNPFGIPDSPFQLPLPSPAAFLGGPAAALLFPPPLQVLNPAP